MYCVRKVPRSDKCHALGEDNRLASTVNFHLIAETELFRFCNIIT